MICKKPYIVAEGQAVGCGQCLPCRLNKRRVWSHRIMLEAKQYTDNAFITLTYDDEHLPTGGTLVPAHYQLWLKRLRIRLQEKAVRYFIVGEYGEGTERPHYHAILFGYPHCRNHPHVCKSRRCEQCSLIFDTWGHGLIQVGTLTHASAQYCAGYITKKLTKADDPRLKGRYPEFARMSLKPGLGAGFMHDLASTIMEHNVHVKLGDVPTAIRHGPKLMPLGRYLTRRLRVLCGQAPESPAITIARANEKMQVVHLAAKEATQSYKIKGLYQTHFSNGLVKANQGKITQIETRAKLFKQRKTL